MLAIDKTWGLFFNFSNIADFGLIDLISIIMEEMLNETYIS